MFAPNPRSTSLKIEGRVTFEDGSTATWHLPEGARVGANLRYYRWRKWLERVRSDDFRTLWEPTCEWIASLYDGRRLARGVGAAGAALPREPPHRRAAARTRSSCTTRARRTRTARDGSATAPARVSLWDGFFFRPRSTAPMTLVRIGWGATAAIWAVSLLPDIDPFFVEGDLMYERRLSPGAWNVLPHLPSDAGLVVCLLLLVASVATMVGWHTRVSAVVAVLMMIVLQRANTAIFNSGDLLLRQVGIAVALAPCGLLWSLDARRNRRKGRVRNVLRAPYGMRFLQLTLALGYFLSAWSKSRGTTWHDGTAIALSLRIEDLQRFVAPDWLYDQRVLLNLFTWVTLAFEATFFVLVWNRRLRPWVLGTGVALHLGIDVFLDIGFFSIAIYLAYLAFLPDEWANQARRPVRPASPDAWHGDRGHGGEASEQREASADLAGGVGGRGSAGAPYPGGAGSAGPDQQ